MSLQYAIFMCLAFWLSGVGFGAVIGLVKKAAGAWLN